MTYSETLREQSDEAAKVRAIVTNAIAALRHVYPPFPDYLPGGALDELIGDLGYWTAEPEPKLTQAWEDLAAEAENPEADETDFRNALAQENA